MHSAAMIPTSTKQATEETELRWADRKGLDMLQVYPFAFAFLSLLVFLGAMVKMAYLAFNPNVQYWIGEYPAWIAFLPLLFIGVAFVIHRSTGQPSKVASLIGLLGPSVMLFIGGYKVAITSLTLSTAFGSTDCITNPSMYQLQQDWQAAWAFKSTCKPMANATGKPMMIDECDGYAAAAVQNKGWDYLAKLEKSSGCGGWCEASTTMWAYPGEMQDPCSSVAAEELSTEVLRPAMQVAIYDILVLFLATVGIAVLGPKAADQGLSW
jgi:hypothetical protein